MVELSPIVAFSLVLKLSPFPGGKENEMKATINILCYSALLCVLLSCSVVAQTFNYLPAEVNGHQKLTYTQFTLSYNEEHEQPDWVAYELTKDEAAMSRDRCDCFKKDNNFQLEALPNPIIDQQDLIKDTSALQQTTICLNKPIANPSLCPI